MKCTEDFTKQSRKLEETTPSAMVPHLPRLTVSVTRGRVVNTKRRGVCGVQTAEASCQRGRKSGSDFARLFNIIALIRQRERGKGGEARTYFNPLIRSIMLLSLGVLEANRLNEWGWPKGAIAAAPMRESGNLSNRTRIY